MKPVAFKFYCIEIIYLGVLSSLSNILGCISCKLDCVRKAYYFFILNNDKNMEKFPIDLILYNIKSAYNVGAIFRTCDASNINKIHLTGKINWPPHKQISKTALGAENTV